MRTILTIILAAFAFSAPAQDMPDCPEGDTAQIVEGEAAFERFCRACHMTDQILKWMERQPDGDSEAALTVFLERHGSCPPPVDAAIAAYLASLPLAP